MKTRQEMITEIKEQFRDHNPSKIAGDDPMVHRAAVEVAFNAGYNLALTEYILRLEGGKK